MIISVVPLGQLANRMIAYMCARNLAWAIGGEVVVNCNLPEWNLTFDQSLHDRVLSNAQKTMIVSDKDLISIQDVCVRIRLAGVAAVVLEGYFQRLHLLDFPTRYREVFRALPDQTVSFAKDELAIHIRAADLRAGVSWYPLVPIEFYRSLVAATGLKPVFLGQLDDSRYARELRAAFPTARMMTPGDAVTDFNRLRSATFLCISVSTFSWLAAWLSDAREIHYPLLGFLHPRRFRYGTAGLGGIDLTPSGDERYRFHLFPEIHGTPEEEYVDFTATIKPISREIPRSIVRRLQDNEFLRDHFEIDEPFDERWYLRTYIDAAWQISEGWFLNAASHFVQIGRRVGYLPYRPLYHPQTSNVALRKIALQSSVSSWSVGKTRAEDAARAVDGNPGKEMAFHTATENRPWWMVDLKYRFQIECINIFNRRSESETIRRRAVPFIIELSMDGVSWTQVARIGSDGTCFGSGPAARAPIPYQWVCQFKHTARYIRLVVEKHECFHLAEVEVYGKMDSTAA